ncbi:hypothetical protein E4T39_04134 [Aureobasidium subglaciale]|nr:hypothetical protein E4T39_04134 [Aureobasidium subglaciale]
MIRFLFKSHSAFVRLAPSWLVNDFGSHEESTYHDEYLTWLFATLFIHHHPDYIDEKHAPEDPSVLLQAVKNKALSYLCRTLEGKTLPSDPIAAESGERYEYYADERKSEADVKQEEGEHEQ